MRSDPPGSDSRDHYHHHHFSVHEVLEAGGMSYDGAVIYHKCRHFQTFAKIMRQIEASLSVERAGGMDASSFAAIFNAGLGDR